MVTECSICTILWLETRLVERESERMWFCFGAIINLILGLNYVRLSNDYFSFQVNSIILGWEGRGRVYKEEVLDLRSPTLKKKKRKYHQYWSVSNIVKLWSWGFWCGIQCSCFGVNLFCFFSISNITKGFGLRSCFATIREVNKGGYYVHLHFFLSSFCNHWCIYHAKRMLMK